jgi:DNA-binding MarR family transcriptional regulator
MGDGKDKLIWSNSIRALIFDVSEKLDDRARVLRKQAGMKDIRPSDAKVAMLVARRSRGLTEIATKLGISRQAAHRSLQRLQEMGAVSFEHLPGNNREKVATLTPLGAEAQGAISSVVKRIDVDVEEIVGKDQMRDLRAALSALSEKLKDM